MLKYKHLKIALMIGATLACMVVALLAVDLSSIGDSLSKANFSDILISGLFICATSLLSVIRFRFVLSNFGFSPTWKKLFSAFALGQLANQIVLNILGQSISRAAILKSDNIPFGASVLATLVERIIAASLLLVASIVSAWYLIPQFGLDFDLGGAYLLSLVIGGLIVILAALYHILRLEKFRQLLLSTIARTLHLWPSGIITIASHLCMLGAYFFSLRSLGIDEFTLPTAAALIIVMFTSSLPISLGGWGIRELSAMSALGIVGIESSTALSAAILIGILSLIIMLALSACGSVFIFTGKRILNVEKPKDTRTSIDKWTLAFIGACCAFTMCAIFFQVRIPLANGFVNVNLADLAALLSLGILGLLLLSSQISLKSLPREVIFAFTLITLFIAFGIVLGFIRFGWIEWGMVNRGLGWIVILGYASIGMLSGLYLSNQARRLLLSLFVTSGVVIAIAQLILFTIVRCGINIPTEAFVIPIEGFNNNANAYAFQLVVASAALCLLVQKVSTYRERIPYDLVLTIFFVAIYFANSRAGLFMLVILLAIWFVLPQAISRLRLLISFFQIAIIGISLIAFLTWLPHAEIFGLYGKSGEYQVGTEFSRPSSDNLRWETIAMGWELWLQNPIFGSGIGGYFVDQMSRQNTFMVIHSAPVWILAEIGIVGILSFTMAILLILSRSWKLIINKDTYNWGSGALMLLIPIMAGNLVHDFIFQRSFWFLLAFFLVAQTSISRQDSSERFKARSFITFLRS